MEEKNIKIEIKNYEAQIKLAELHGEDHGYIEIMIHRLGTLYNKLALATV